MSKFDLEKAMADGGKCIMLYGHGNILPARIICADRKNTHPILALVDVGGIEQIHGCLIDGIRETNDGLNPDRLLNTPETYDVWITLYRNSGCGMTTATFQDDHSHETFQKHLRKGGAEIVSVLKTQMVEGENRIQVGDNALPLEK